MPILINDFANLFVQINKFLQTDFSEFEKQINVKFEDIDITVKSKRKAITESSERSLKSYQNATSNYATKKEKYDK